MRSVVQFSVLSFFIIFVVTFLLTGVFSGAKRAWDQQRQDEPVAEQVDENALARQSLHAKSEEISRREGELADIEEALQLEKAVLAEEFNKLAAVRGSITEAVAAVDAGQAKTLRKLAKMYENMPAREAAVILSGMDLEVVLEIVKLMKERPAAKIMAALDPARAAALSNMMSASKGDR